MRPRARTNDLLALGGLLQHQTGEISIPVYLADSILTPSQGTDILAHHGYSVNTTVGRLTIPRFLVSAQYTDQLATQLEECVNLGLTPDQLRTHLAKQPPLIHGTDNAELGIALDLDR